MQFVFVSLLFVLFKQKTAYEMRISDWSSDVCSSDLPDAYRAWLAPDADAGSVTLVEGEPGAEPDIQILLPEGAVPWAGHSGRYAVHQEIGRASCRERVCQYV